ncbi:hypothetical protein PHMEG_00029407 [Phytophthora megakarya]|uniref:PiggyBac transposable element-derived protein domain-containing protein n=1 Tax=Phytophthora megakarya TaxID=4795 RepID=A0A225V3P6_9STRA|nr:hypothetical protein PHMEG_00029407 [Phytophthora megakarya]
METSRNRHFNPNSDPRAHTDRSWKIRKVVEVLQQTFARGFVAPSHLAFDEAILPSRSPFNKIRLYLKDKPHKWDTKLFMLCSDSVLHSFNLTIVDLVNCIRPGLKCIVKSQHKSDAHKTDMKSGLAAVV